jgi:hypothetical protein
MDVLKSVLSSLVMIARAESAKRCVVTVEEPVKKRVMTEIRTTVMAAAQHVWSKKASAVILSTKAQQTNASSK